MARKVHEPTVKEMQRLIYQVNKRLYRLEKSGISETSSAYNNALEIIRRGERKENKMRLTVSKNETSLKRQYLKALEIANAPDYDMLSKQYMKKEIERIRAIEQGDNREQTFKKRFKIDNVDYAVYNLFKTRQFKQLSGSAGSHQSDLVLSAIADAVNAGLGTSQIQKMLREFIKESQSDSSYDFKKLSNIAHEYALKYGLEE